MSGACDAWTFALMLKVCPSTFPSSCPYFLITLSPHFFFICTCRLSTCPSLVPSHLYAERGNRCLLFYHAECVSLSLSGWCAWNTLSAGRRGRTRSNWDQTCKRTQRWNCRCQRNFCEAANVCADPSVASSWHVTVAPTQSYLYCKLTLIVKSQWSGTGVMGNRVSPWWWPK